MMSPSWMASATRAGLGLLALASVVLCAPSQYVSCRQATDDPLDGCPAGTLLVSASGCGGAHFNTIQSAIESLPHDNSTRVILVLPGNYVEQLNVTRPGPLALLGQTAHPTIQARNEVTVYWASADVDSDLPDNEYSAVLTVAPTLESSLTGSGPTGYPVPAGTPFGSVMFGAYNINFRNVFADTGVGPSLALSVSYANAGFYWCGFYSLQDTVYVGKLGNVYFYYNEIAGETDFLYGFGTAWVQHSNISLRNCGGGITAWKGTNTTFPNKYGVYVSDSFVNAANRSIAPAIAGRCSMGRPWNDLHRSVYLNTWLDGSILPAGYTTWDDGAPYSAGSNYDNNTIMGEYGSSGPGFDLAARLAGNVTMEFDADQARVYRTPKDVFMTPAGAQPDIAWIDPGTYTW